MENKLRLTVAEVLKLRGPHRYLFLKPDCPIQRAAQKLIEWHVSAVLIVNDYDILLGIVSETDINRVVAKLSRFDFSPLFAPVSDIMTQKLITVRPEDPIDKATELMRTHHIRHLVVPNEVLRSESTIVSIRDILYAYSKALEHLADTLLNRGGSDDPLN